MSNVSVDRRVITPEIAAKMLERNTINRPMSRIHVAFLKREMTSGKWKFNGDTIVTNGTRLIDGQHRLRACVESGVSFETLVVEGIEQDVFDTKDIGKRRSKGDTLAVKGEKNTKLLASTLVFVDEYITGPSMKSKQYTNMDVEALLQKYPDIRPSVTFASSARKRSAITGTMIAGCHYLFSRKDAELAELFFDALLRGVDLQDDEPVYLLRERLNLNAFSKAKLPQVEIFALMIKAWNATREGRQIKVLRWSAGQNEDFPRIK
jgi:hypothetical protein